MKRSSAPDCPICEDTGYIVDENDPCWNCNDGGRPVNEGPHVVVAELALLFALATAAIVVLVMLG